MMNILRILYMMKKSAAQPADPTLVLVWNSIDNVPVSDANNVDQWNTWLGIGTILPTATPFDSVEVKDDSVFLYNGADIELHPSSFSGNSNLIAVYDILSSEGISPVIGIGSGCFSGLSSLDYIELKYCQYVMPGGITACPKMTFVRLDNCEKLWSNAITDCVSLSTVVFIKVGLTIGDYGLSALNALEEIYIRGCIELGSTVGDNKVFYNTQMKSIVLFVPAALMTCNDGNPDGDIQFLQANNTVTVITV